jgi:hypothetical protein
MVPEAIFQRLDDGALAQLGILDKKVTASPPTNQHTSCTLCPRTTTNRGPIHARESQAPLPPHRNMCIMYYESQAPLPPHRAPDMSHTNTHTNTHTQTHTGAGANR